MFNRAGCVDFGLQLRANIIDTIFQGFKTLSHFSLFLLAATHWINNVKLDGL